MGTNRAFKLEEKHIARTNGLKLKPDKFKLEIRHKIPIVMAIYHWIQEKRWISDVFKSRLNAKMGDRSFSQTN